MHKDPEQPLAPPGPTPRRQTANAARRASRGVPRPVGRAAVAVAMFGGLAAVSVGMAGRSGAPAFGLSAASAAPAAVSPGTDPADTGTGAPAGTASASPAESGTGASAATASPSPTESGTGTPAASPGTAGAGVGYDPPTAEESARARTIAVDAALLDSTVDVNRSRGPEMLDPELVVDDAAGAPARTDRRIGVYLYDYKGNTLIKRVVNLTSGKVESSVSAQKVQPPLSQREVATAFQILMGSDSADTFKSRFRQATGRDFTDPGQVTLVGHTYVPLTDRTGASQCAVDRCAVLVPRVPDGPFIDLTDLAVDLSGRTVAKLR